jgi:hypothetical protein
VSAGVFAGNYRFDVNTIDISTNGTGIATWRATYGRSYDIAKATFRLTSVHGREAAGVVDKFGDPKEWKAGQVFQLKLRSNDMLLLTPSGPFAPLCGLTAQREWNAGKAPTGVDCGA